MQLCSLREALGLIPSTAQIGWGGLFLQPGKVEAGRSKVQGHPWKLLEASLSYRRYRGLYLKQKTKQTNKNKQT